MIHIRDITAHLEALAPLCYQESYDNSGLLLGNPEQEVKGILISLDVTEQVVLEALKKGCNLLVAHHPPIFSGIKSITGKTYVEKIVLTAIKHDVALYAAHTNLDNVQGGVNAMLAGKIGLKNSRILSPRKGVLKKLVTFCPHDKAATVKDAIFSAGAGVIGNYDSCSYNITGTGTFRATGNANPYIGKPGELHQEPETRIETIFPANLEHTIVAALLRSHPYEEVAYDIYTLENLYPGAGSGIIGTLENVMEEKEFLAHLKHILHAQSIRYTRFPEKKIKNVAVCGGSGSFLLKEAIAAGADAFVSADFKYHQFFDAEEKILLADAGHYETEQFTKDLLFGYLTKKFSTFAIEVSGIETNPVNYF